MSRTILVYALTLTLPGALIAAVALAGGNTSTPVPIIQDGPYLDVHHSFTDRNGPHLTTVDGIESACVFYHWPTPHGTKTVALCNGHDYAAAEDDSPE